MHWQFLDTSTGNKMLKFYDNYGKELLSQYLW